MRPRFILSSVFLVLLLATHTTASEMNIAWDLCGPPGASNKNFSCDTNTGSSAFFASFIPDVREIPVAYVEVYVGVYSPNPLPDWWLLSSDGCRASALAPSANPDAASATCQAMQGMTLFSSRYDQIDPALGQLSTITAVAPPEVLSPTTEYFAVRGVVNYSKTTGPGLCSGCTSPVKLSISFVRFYSEGGISWDLYASSHRQSIITWQGGNVPTRSTTWGQIKSLYRGPW